MKHEQNTQFRANAQQATIYVPPVVFTDEQIADLRRLGREQYGLCPDDVEEYIRLEAALDWYARVSETLGHLPPIYNRAWVETQNAHYELTTRPRHMRAAA
jgi:hypothetical protein